ncbi:[FeFe] hydrogenase H-cluster maturation GTPase HydF [Thermotoga profunda]|uniref:[FeFe] hydrogenase H-cluster maturation GTPase HydF n=1 Tax=Thermotoga profunda TaxID=1508420 RepID=UPI000596D975|nr:[FeFe] hydrogenase H-cluster maturation GTPase HydF [Thermotoga profunda]
MNISHAGFRKYVAIAGRRNVGKSSLINAIARQDIAIVSEIPGTTTDPVYKTLEIQPIGPVTLIDTPGIDDQGIVGQKRVERAKRSLYRADAAILVTDDRPSYYEQMLVDILRELEIPFVIAVNKSDLHLDGLVNLYEPFGVPIVEISAKEGKNIHILLEKLSQIIPEKEEKPLVGHLLKRTKTAILVVPIDKAAPKGRLIMPQVEAIREIIDFGGTAVVTRDVELADTLTKLSNNVDLVVTDSQVVMKIEKIVPEKIPLTTFSILEAANKGDLKFFMEGIEKLKLLRDNDQVAVVEACSHVPTCDDIGRVKIPRWIEQKMKLRLNYKFFAGKEFPDLEELQECQLIIHCGGCVLTRSAFMRRMTLAKRLKIPVVNYGMLISHLHGVLDRVLKPLIQ